MIEYTQTELRVMALVAAVGTTFSWLVGGIDNLVIALLVLIVVDYLTGLVAAWKTGTLASKKGFCGVGRKLVMLVIVVMANWVDVAMGNSHAIRSMIAFAYIGNDGLSIVENIDRMGYGEFIPQIVRDKLSQLRTEKGGRCQ